MFLSLVTDTEKITWKGQNFCLRRFFSWFPNVLITVRFDWYEESLLVLGEILRQEFGVKSSEKDVPFFFSPFSNFKC